MPCSTRFGRFQRPAAGTLFGGIALIVAVIVVLPGVAQAAKQGNSLNAKACQKGGWKDLFRSDGSSFTNQGACTSYAARGGTLWSRPPGQSAAVCESLGGTFGTGGPDELKTRSSLPVLWVCNNVPTERDEFEYYTPMHTLAGACRSSDGGPFGATIADDVLDSTCYAVP